jgi:1-deoxy-D-xylulose-5-phosphate synthase
VPARGPRRARVSAPVRADTPTIGGVGQRVLDGVGGPRDLRRLSRPQLDTLAVEIREQLVRTVSRTGGHLGPNLGVVELTIALHRVFDSPNDRIVFDTGHQSYVHKLLTGRLAQFETLKQRGGLSGYPSRAESPHDIVENSHASTSLSWAVGLAQAAALRDERRHVVAVIGDGALTGGMAWEALNNIATGNLPIVIVVNDNGRSYTPTVGGLARYLAVLRTHPGYERVLDGVRGVLGRTPLVGRPLFEALHGAKKGLKDLLAPQGMFEDLGLKYVGPVDGHDRQALEAALTAAKRFGGPVIVHAVTRKGEGFGPAVRHEEDLFHSPKPFDPITGITLTPPAADWTSVFRDTLVKFGEERPDIVAISAAMTYPTGLDAFAALHPDRVLDVGIAEQHAVTSAAGMAAGGLHPVVAVYATFLNRAFDQVLLDVALHHAGVTFVLDRAGITGDDGPSHNGMWDLAALAMVPTLRVAAPRDAPRLRELLAEAIDVADAPTVVRFPKGALPVEIPALPAQPGEIGIDVLRRYSDADSPAGAGGGDEGRAPDVLLVAVGAMATMCLEVADRLAAQGIGVTVVDPRWVLPPPPAVVGLAAGHRLVVCVEDGVRTNGVGAVLAQAVTDADCTARVRCVGLPRAFPEHGSRTQVLAASGLTAQDIARDVAGWVAALPSDGGHPDSVDAAAAEDLSHPAD